MAGIELVLYVTGDGPRAREAMAVVERLRSEHLGEDCALTVVDTARQPEAAATDAVRMTPTLIRRRPEPQRRVVGDLGEAGAVLRTLGLGDG